MSRLQKTKEKQSHYTNKQLVFRRDDNMIWNYEAVLKEQLEDGKNDLLDSAKGLIEVQETLNPRTVLGGRLFNLRLTVVKNNQ